MPDHLLDDAAALHISNGDRATDLMRTAGFRGTLLPWRDCLHEGPVPSGLDREGLDRCRTTFLVSAGLGEEAEIGAGFRQRAETVERWRQFRSITLWFEHDLYDQLQVIEILSELHRLGADDIGLVQSDTYLGMLTPPQLTALTATRTPVTEQQSTLARRAWQAFRSDTPRAWAALSAQETTPLPFLHQAIERHLQEFPHRRNGLSRTRHQILSCLHRQGTLSPGPLFVANQQLEQANFLGDSLFWLQLDELISGGAVAVADGGPFHFPDGYPPSTRFKKQRLSLTALGEALLADQEDWCEAFPVDRWLGGVELKGRNPWRWCPESHAVIPPTVA
ncbi:MAG: hypothetical protein HQL50_15180 [Magnetococcales bacterium]|nr:hypothetical protein [Magnetococcales bacterium]